MVKVHIISGFLGAGKTTLIRKLITNIKGEKVIIENEFGEVGIDGEILERENYNVVELAEGCICCSLKTDFEESIKSVMRDYKPEHIIIEPTGVGLLSDILKVFTETDLKDKAVLTLPITVVDPLEYLLHIESFGSFFRDQIANAGIIVLSKTQLADKENISKVIKSIRKINSNCEIISENWDNFTPIEYNELTNIEYSLSKSDIKFVEIEENIGEELSSISIGEPKDFTKQELEERLEKLTDDEYGNLVRAKGFVSGSDGDLEFSYVNTSFQIRDNELKNNNRICFIGKNLNKDKLLEEFKKEC